MMAMIFDVDGTLLHSAADDEAIYCAAICEVLGPVRFRNNLHDYPHVTDSGIFDQVLIDNQIDAAPEIEASARAAVLDRIRQHIHEHGPFTPVTGARKMLHRIENSPQYSLAIATGGWRSVAEYKLSTAGFDIAGLAMATSDDSHQRVEIMRTALERADGIPGDVTYFGDAPWDRAACSALGWKFVAVGPIVEGIVDFRTFDLE